jgi:hypothetical protein
MAQRRDDVRPVVDLGDWEGGQKSIPVQITPGVRTNVQMTDSQARLFTNRDAWDRAWRTLKTGVGVDIAIAIVIALLPVLTNIEWTGSYWIVLASAVGKGVIQAVVSYYYRKLVSPKVGVKLK